MMGLDDANRRDWHTLPTYYAQLEHPASQNIYCHGGQLQSTLHRVRVQSTTHWEKIKAREEVCV